MHLKFQLNLPESHSKYEYFENMVTGTSLVAQKVKNLPAVQETWVRSLGWEVPLEKAMATHSNILAWRIPWTEDRGRV